MLNDNEHRPEGGEGGSHVKSWRQSFSGSGNGKCKGPEVGVCQCVQGAAGRPGWWEQKTDRAKG